MDYQSCSDEMLIDMYRVGDRFAIDVLFERYKNLVRKKAKAMYLAGGDSDDLIQEGMIGLYKAVRDYDDSKEATFATFASLCINRQMISAVTAYNRKKNTPLNSYLSFDLPANTDDENEMRLVDVLKTDDDSDPESMYIDREYTLLLKEHLMKSLSPFEKQVIELYLEGNDYREIANILDKPPKAIDNALQRIRTKAGAWLTK